MKILAVADCHDKLLFKELENSEGLAEKFVPSKFDAVFFLGDNSANDIECVQDFLRAKKINAPYYGILGNHDYSGTLKRRGVKDIHLETVTIQGFRVGGFGGSFRYKEDKSYMMFTNEQSLSLLEDFPACDIFITHSNPQFYEYEEVEVPPSEPVSFFEKIKNRFFPPIPEYEMVQKPLQNSVHSGLIGIGIYIERYKPQYYIHGHIHQRSFETRGRTKIECCYGVQTLTID